MTDKEEIMSQKWLKGIIEYIGQRTKTGLIKSEDGTFLVEFDESAPAAFDQLKEKDTVLFTLTKDEPDARGVTKAQRIFLSQREE